MQRQLLFVIAAIALLVGCDGGGNGPTGPGNNSPLVGSWILTDATSNGQPDPYGEMFGRQGEINTFRSDGTLSVGNPGITSSPPAFDEYTWSVSGSTITVQDASSNSTESATFEINGTTLRITQVISNNVYVSTCSRIPDPSDVRIVGEWLLYKVLRNGQPDPAGQNYGAVPYLLFLFADGQGIMAQDPFANPATCTWTAQNGQLTFQGNITGSNTYRYEDNEFVFVSTSGSNTQEEFHRRH